MEEIYDSWRMGFYMLKDPSDRNFTESFTARLESFGMDVRDLTTEDHHVKEKILEI